MGVTEHSLLWRWWKRLGNSHLCSEELTYRVLLCRFTGWPIDDDITDFQMPGCVGLVLWVVLLSWEKSYCLHLGSKGLGVPWNQLLATDANLLFSPIFLRCLISPNTEPLFQALQQKESQVICVGDPGDHAELWHMSPLVQKAGQRCC